MQPLKDRLISRIAATGPISLADYMTTCLLDPDQGYYTTQMPLGAAGDFVTAPEISQMFGEMLGLALAQAWLDQGSPTEFLLAELGPGRGTLMADILRATRGVPGFSDAAKVHLVEAAPKMRALQRATLDGARVTWADRLADLPKGPLFLIANEFFDALPIRQFQRADAGWCEHMIGADGNRLVMGLSPAAPIADLDHRLADTTPGDIVELCAPAAAIAGEIGVRIANHGGAALIVDYGNWRSRGDTFQALTAHAPTDPLADPGQSDLTAHVDFEALATALQPAKCSPMTDQGILLARLGMAERTAALAKSLTGGALENHLAAYRRLTAADEMGTLFKAISARPEGTPAIAGFDP